MTDFSPDEVYAAARHRHFVREDYYPSADVAAASKAQSDLISRSWGAGKEMSREERRLFGRYQRALDAETRSDVLAYREHLGQLSQKSRELGAALTSLREQET
jgi:hypothetical protein